MFNQLSMCFYINHEKHNKTCRSGREVLTTRPAVEQYLSWHDTVCPPTQVHCLKLLTTRQQVLPSTPRSYGASPDCLQVNNTQQGLD